MLANNLSNTTEILEAWEDTIGDIGLILENTERVLRYETLTDEERRQLEGLHKILEAVQECY